jgi:hypothetical protein
MARRWPLLVVVLVPPGDVHDDGAGYDDGADTPLPPVYVYLGLIGTGGRRKSGALQARRRRLAALTPSSAMQTNPGAAATRILGHQSRRSVLLLFFL